MPVLHHTPLSAGSRFVRLVFAEFDETVNLVEETPWISREELLELNPAGTLPVLTIDDWPDFKDRGIYYDVARGRVPKTERLVALAGALSQFKINQLQPYIEHTFSFRGHPDIGKGASPLKPDDILALDQACRDRHVELVPSLASFGHLSPVLRLPQYRSRICAD